MAGQESVSGGLEMLSVKDGMRRIQSVCVWYWLPVGVGHQGVEGMQPKAQRRPRGP